MHTYLYTGGDKTKSVRRLAVGLASMDQPTLVARFGALSAKDPLLYYAQVLPLEVTCLRLPGLGLPQGHTPADEVVVGTTMATLRQIVASGDYRLVILDGIREAVERGILGTDELERLVQSAADRTQLAMT